MNNNKPYEISVWEDVLGYEVEERIVDPDGEHSGAQSKTGIEIEGQTYGINMGANAGYLSLEKNENGTSLVYTEINEVAHKAELDLENYEVVDCLVKERKIGIIGSSSMTAQHRAMNGKLVSNVNGSNTLTFSMYHKYYDNESGEYVENPFIKLLTNERRVKLRLGNPGDADVEWYDFVIKNVQESSDSKVFNYTCTDLFINELSKNGYNITLDGELENNIGTPKELAEQVLEGSGWQVEDGDLIHTFNEEPVYRVTFDKSMPLIPVSKKRGDPSFELPAGVGALVFYSSLMARDDKLQILCAINEDGTLDTKDKDDNGKDIIAGRDRKDWVMDEDGYVVASEHTDNPRARQFIVENITWGEITQILPNEVGDTTFLTSKMDLRGKRIVRAQETKYDANLEKYVSRYSKMINGAIEVELDSNGEEKPVAYWCFAESDKTELTVLNNYITNPSNFKDTSGWEVLTKDLDGQTKVSFVSNYTSGLATIKNEEIVTSDNITPVKSWIKMDFSSGHTVGNTGLWDYLYDYDKISNGDTFILGVVFDNVRWPQVNGKDDLTQEPTITTGALPQMSIKLYDSRWSNNPTTVATLNSISTDRVVGTEEIIGKEERAKYNEWHFYECIFNQKLTHKELTEKELRLCFNKIDRDVYYLREAMLFKKHIVLKTKEIINGQPTDTTEIVQNEEENKTHYLLPGEFTNKPLVLPEYKIYRDKASEGNDIETTKYELETKDATELEKQGYIPYYDETAAARVQVTAKESNRFNILQDIAEAAQCWVKFSIKHNAHTGHIEMDEQNRPIKRVSFHQFSGKNNSAGFKYGINLKSIQRTVESNQLTTKLIVKPNSNEFADAKQCAIGKAKSNPTKEDTLYNLNYYINHGMIGYDTWMDDMYGDNEENGKLRYQQRMREAVEEYDEINKQVIYYSNLINKLESEYTVYKNARDSAVDARKSALESIMDYTNKYIYRYKDSSGNYHEVNYNDYVQFVNDDDMYVMISVDKTDSNGNKITEEAVKVSTIKDEQGNSLYKIKPKTIQGLKTYCTNNSFQFEKCSIESYFSHYVADKMIEIDTLTEKIYNYDIILKDDITLFPNEKDRATGLAASLEEAKEEYKKLKDKLKEIKKKRELIEQALFERYGRFLQEGTWISEDYFDNELYYLEAVNVSNTSAFPQVSYTINVIDVSRIEGYENITFAVGDKSYIQDTEFFGWKIVKDKDNIDRKTPYKEEVICSEVARVLDDGSQNTIKVQNYKNQFEDLFQRINATTQQVQYKSGEYQKAANAFTEQGELQGGTLAAALENSTATIMNAANEETWMDKTGFNTRSLSNPNLLTRMAGGGIAISKDGGKTWGNAITGEGINTNKLAAGQINAGLINICAGDGIPFRWDAKGISSYASAYKDANGTIQNLESFDTSTFVRFDQFGIYGVQGEANFHALNNNEIGVGVKATPFGLTWNGFFFRTGEVGNGVTIDSTDDICVREGGDIRVKIGRIGDEYGLVIYGGDKDENGNQIPVISQDSSGKLKVVGDITATNLTIGEDATISGKIIATTGEIGGWKIGDLVKATYSPKGSLFYDAEQKGMGSANTIYLLPYKTGESVQIGQDTLNNWLVTVGSNFGITEAGAMYANAGKIGNWNIEVNKLTSVSGKVGLSSNTNQPAFWAGSDTYGGPDLATPHEIDGTKFYVTHDGYMCAREANITGTITANDGKIGGWFLDDYKLYSFIEGVGPNNANIGTGMSVASAAYNDPAFYAGFSGDTNPWIHTNRGGDWRSATRFYVTGAGELHATGAVISGTITADKGTIGGCSIIDGKLRVSDQCTIGNFTIRNGSITGGSYPHITISTSGIEFDDDDGSNSASTKRSMYLGIKNSKSFIEISGMDDYSANLASFNFDLTSFNAKINNSYLNILDSSVKLYAGGIPTSAALTLESAGNLSIYSKAGSSYRVRINEVYFCSDETKDWICFGKTASNSPPRIRFVRSGENTDGNQTNNLGFFDFSWITIHHGGLTVKGSIYDNNGIISGSDLRIKNNIHQLNNDYDALFDNLNPVSFKLNEGTSDRIHIGFIAQEIVSAIEKTNLTTQDFAAVCQKDINDPDSEWGVRYDEFISLNTWQIQKLKSRVSELEAKIAQLEAKI